MKKSIHQVILLISVVFFSGCQKLALRDDKSTLLQANLNIMASHFAIPTPSSNKSSVQNLVPTQFISQSNLNKFNSLLSQHVSVLNSPVFLIKKFAENSDNLKRQVSGSEVVLTLVESNLSQSKKPETSKNTLAELKGKKSSDSSKIIWEYSSSNFSRYFYGETSLDYLSGFYNFDRTIHGEALSLDAAIEIKKDTIIKKVLLSNKFDFSILIVANYSSRAALFENKASSVEVKGELSHDVRISGGWNLVQGGQISLIENINSAEKRKETSYCWELNGNDVSCN